MSKSFGGRVLPFVPSRPAIPVLQDVSLALHPGETVLLRGANGSGKTTLLRIIAGLVTPRRGTVDLRAAGGSRALGFSSGEERSLFWRLNARHNLEFFGALYRLSRDESSQRAAELLIALGLADQADTPVRSLSSGQKQRLLVGRALMGEPAVVLLDEPTGHMDDEAASLVWTLLERCADRGAAVLLATHRDDDEEHASTIVTLSNHRLYRTSGVMAGQQTPAPRTVSSSALRPRMGASVRWPGAFVRRDFAIARSYPLSLLLRALGPVLSSTLIFFLGRVVGSGSHYLASYGGDYFTFALLGMAAFGLQSLPITSFSGAVREAQLTGTLEAMMATPLPFPLMLVGSALWSVLLSVLEMILLLLIGLELFHLQLHHPLWTLVVLALLLSLLSTGGLALLDAAFLLVFKRGAPTTIALGYATNLLGGVLYPIAVLPVPLRLIAGLLPVTHSANMLRFSLEASNGSQALFEGIALAALTALYLSAGLLAVSLALRVVRAESTLGQY